MYHQFCQALSAFVYLLDLPFSIMLILVQYIVQAIEPSKLVTKGEQRMDDRFLHELKLCPKRLVIFIDNIQACPSQVSFSSTMQCRNRHCSC